MQQHAGQHVLSAAFVRNAGAETTSFHLGAKVSTIDLDKSSLSEKELDAAERAANDVVARAVPIKSRFVSGVEALTLELRKTPPKQDSLRIVEVEGFDHQACCGTHPRSSAEIGPVVIRGLEKLKDSTRVEFLCGERALRDYRTTVRRIRSLASVLSSSEADLVDTAKKLQDERKSMGKQLRRLRSEALAASAEMWMRDADVINGVGVLTRDIPGVGAAELRVIRNAARDRARTCFAPGRHRRWPGSSRFRALGRRRRFHGRASRRIRRARRRPRRWFAANISGRRPRHPEASRHPRRRARDACRATGAMTLLHPTNACRS